jgi:D-alanine-D-alanine ligase
VSPTVLTVAVLRGGRSSEHEVSLASGQAVGDGLAQAGHRVLDVEIDRDGIWRCGGKEVALEPGRGLLYADVVFPVLHGPFGEDGTIQGLLECLGDPYVGADVAASALCMDKVRFKDLMGVTHPQWRAGREAVLAKAAALGLPVFVKPARLGSSVGIARVDHAEALPDAIDAAFAHDPRVIVEALAPGIEVECAVLGNWPTQLLASPPGEIVLGSTAAERGGWYDFEAKYTPGGMELLVPARLTQTALERVRAIALHAFTLAACDGLARVDFFVDGESVLLNELNTLPGFTPTSVYAKLIEAVQIPYPVLVDRLCRLALERAGIERGYRF